MDEIICEGITWELALFYYGKSKRRFQREENAIKAIKECQSSHLNGDCILCGGESK